MKTRFLLIAGCVFFLAALSSCHIHHNNHDVSISIKEDEDIYQLSAEFDDRKTEMVESFIREQTMSDGLFNYGGHGDMDATLTLDDHTRVYIKSRRGQLKVKFNKEENSEESYDRIKDMCEGIKNMLAKQ